MKEFKPLAAILAILLITAATVQASPTAGFTSRSSSRDNDVFNSAFTFGGLMPPDVNDALERFRFYDSNGFSAGKGGSRGGGSFTSNATSAFAGENEVNTDSAGLAGNIEDSELDEVNYGEIDAGSDTAGFENDATDPFNTDCPANGNNATSVPAPSAILLVLTGTAAAGVLRKRKLMT